MLGNKKGKEEVLRLNLQNVHSPKKSSPHENVTWIRFKFLSLMMIERKTENRIDLKFCCFVFFFTFSIWQIINDWNRHKRITFISDLPAKTSYLTCLLKASEWNDAYALAKISAQKEQDFDSIAVKWPNLTESDFTKSTSINLVTLPYRKP